jgi:hypothetical protein
MANQTTKAPTLRQVAMVLQAISRIEGWGCEHPAIEQSILKDRGWVTLDINERSMPMPSTALLTQVRLLGKIRKP